MKFVHKIISPVGILRLEALDENLTGIYFDSDSQNLGSNDVEAAHHPVIKQTILQLAEYFNNSRREFDLPIQFIGTEFQQRVWESLRAIPYGTTVSYADIALRLSNGKATRAVGAANGKNPIAIVVPCHRVIGANGSITGYGGGIERKQFLLRHEGTLKTLF